MASLARRPLRSFDLLARPYRWFERLTFGSALHRARTRFLPDLLRCQTALLLGDGDGRFLRDLLQASPHLHATAVDSSPAMLAALRRRCPSSAHLTLLHAEALAAPALLQRHRPFDLVVTHFFLDCLSTEHLHLLLARLTPQLSPGALWVLSDFRIPPSPTLARAFARLLIRTLYLAFGLLTGLRARHLPDHETALHHAGFTLRARHLSLGGLLTAEVWQLPASNPA